MPAATIAIIEVNRFMSITNGFNHNMVDPATHVVTTCSTVANQAYGSEAFLALISDCGFTTLQFSPSLSGNQDNSCADRFGSFLRKFGLEQQMDTAQLPEHPLSAAARLKKVHMAARRRFYWKGSAR